MPAPARASWSARWRALDDELRQRREGYRHASRAHLRLLLIDVARLARATAGHIEPNVDPLLAEVFEFIDSRYRDRISLSDVAAAVYLSPGHLTTIVGRKTGRTVQGWITERRLAEARRLLAETDVAVEEVGRRVGYRDASFFIRAFRRDHGVTPGRWRLVARQ